MREMFEPNVVLVTNRHVEECQDFPRCAVYCTQGIQGTQNTHVIRKGTCANCANCCARGGEGGTCATCPELAVSRELK